MPLLRLERSLDILFNILPIDKSPIPRSREQSSSAFQSNVEEMNNEAVPHLAGKIESPRLAESVMVPTYEGEQFHLQFFRQNKKYH